MEANKMPQQPIFILGAARSGTTLLRLMLTSHPDICIPPESGFFIRLEPKYGKIGNLENQAESFLFDLYKQKKFDKWGIDRNGLLMDLTRQKNLDYSKAISMVYQAYARRHDPESIIWGDKSPGKIYHVDTILKYFPNTKFILIIRDARATHNSIKTAVIKDWGKCPKAYLLTRAKDYLKVGKIFETYKKSGQFYFVYYEDLVANPAEQLENLCQWLGVQYYQSMLNFHKKNINENLIPKSSHHWHQNTFRPVTAERINAWQKELNVAEIEAIEIRCRKLLALLGYRPITSGWRYRGVIRLLLEYSLLPLVNLKLYILKTKREINKLTDERFRKQIS